MSAPDATGQVEVAVPAESAYALITDLDRFAAVTEEAVAMEWTTGSSAAAGAVFRGRNRNGVRRWSTACTVVEAVPGTRFAFDVTSGGKIKVARWQYDIESTGPSSCRVIESTWDQRPAWFVKPAGLVTGVADRKAGNSANIEATLQRLKAALEA
ncbi:MAG: SRPBCC family protein [Nocardioides sp.]